VTGLTPDSSPFEIACINSGAICRSNWAAMGHLGCNTAWMPVDAQGEDRRILERLALDDWSPKAGAQVVSVSVAEARAEVALLVNGDYGYWMYFLRGDQGWYETESGNGPTIDWDDPTFIQWGDEPDPSDSGSP
jgi:hypothetical protein